MSKKISVIIPCFNATQWLPKCFLSLFKQTIGIENIELIFVDDASTDNNKTWEMLTDIERAFPESIIILKLEKNLRQGGARNIALKYASGEYIAFVDADDFVSTNYFLEAYNIAKTYNCDIVQFEYDYFTESLGTVSTGRKISPEYIEIHSMDERKHFLITEKLTYGCWNKLYKHELIKKSNVRYAEHCIYEEPLFVYPLLFYADRIVITDKIFYHYRQNSSGTMRHDMKDDSTLKMHANVQLSVWNFMKQTPYFAKYYDEIKLYFLHTYLYETLYFSKLRNFEISLSFFNELRQTIITEVPDYKSSPYADIIPLQMKLYNKLDDDINIKWLTDYIETL